MNSHQPSQIRPLDGVRGVAALIVMAYHFWLQGGFADYPLSGVFRVLVFGQTGVDLFFVLSGFLITRILIATRDYDYYFSNFYWRRALRILPLYYGFLVLFYFVLPLLKAESIAPFKSTWWCWFYLQNVPVTFQGLTYVGPGHYWSLAVEEHFYLLWPLVVYLTPRGWLQRVAWIIILTALTSRWCLRYGLDVNVMSFTPCRMDALAFGALLACSEATGTLHRQRYWFCGLMLGYVVFRGLSFHRIPGDWNSFVQVFQFSALGVLYYSLVGLVVIYRGAGLVNAAFGNRPVVFTGKISYGLYVFHQMCFGMIFSVLPPKQYPVLCLVVSFGMVFLVCWLSFVWFESRFLALKRFFSYDNPATREKATGEEVVPAT